MVAGRATALRRAGITGHSYREAPRVPQVELDHPDVSTVPLIVTEADAAVGGALGHARLQYHQHYR